MDKNPVSINSNNTDSICLVRSKAQHYAPLLSWVKDDFVFVQWAGPSLERPSSASVLETSLQIGNYQSFSLVTTQQKQDQLLGFGQIQIWSSRAHLGRLIIAPEHRKKGLSYVLVNRLIQEAARQQPIQSVSLFVYDNNIAAKTSYDNLGFVPAPYPPSIAQVPDCTFMTLDY
jgi:ribosomal protein S18 acetylase RimI-like enzyme